MCTLSYTHTSRAPSVTLLSETRNRRVHMCSCAHALIAETSTVTMKDIDLIAPSKTLVSDLIIPPCAECRASTLSRAWWQRSPSQSFHALPRSQKTKLLPQSLNARVSSPRERISNGRSAPASGRVIDLNAALCSEYYLALSWRPLQPKV